MDNYGVINSMNLVEIFKFNIRCFKAEYIGYRKRIQL